MPMPADVSAEWPATCPTTWLNALRPPSGPTTIVVVIDSHICRAAIAPRCERVRVLLERNEVDMVTCEVGGLAVPDLATVEVLARLKLTAQRLGSSIHLRHLGSELKELLILTGLYDVLTREPGRQLEQPEQARIEESADAADLVG
jgi:hypothetical protein